MRKERQELLYIWKRDSSTKPQSFKPSGETRCQMTFANNTDLLVLVETPTRQLEIWNTKNAKLSGVIPIEEQLIHHPELGASFKEPLNVKWVPLDFHLVVSPGGKYAAAMSAKGVVMISLVENKVLGTMPIKAIDEKDYLTFSGKTHDRGPRAIGVEKCASVVQGQ